MSNQFQSRLTATIPAGVHYLMVDQFPGASGTLPCGVFSITPSGIPP
ncbi:MAG: hypothetical protein WCJ30_08195 [Deltaproteobacteria bacterium]